MLRPLDTFNTPLYYSNQYHPAPLYPKLMELMECFYTTRHQTMLIKDIQCQMRKETPGQVWLTCFGIFHSLARSISGNKLKKFDVDHLTRPTFVTAVINNWNYTGDMISYPLIIGIMEVWTKASFWFCLMLIITQIVLYRATVAVPHPAGQTCEGPPGQAAGDDTSWWFTENSHSSHVSCRAYLPPPITVP